MKRAAALFLTLFIVLSGAFAGGSQDTKGKTTVVFWNGYTGPDRPVLEKIVEDYNNAQDSVIIKMEIMPWDTLFQKLMPALIAGNGPDLIAMSVGRYAEYAQAGKLANLDSMLAQSKDLSATDLVPGLMDAGIFGGTRYAMPMSFAAIVMYYNKAMFREAGLNPDNPPKTMAELQNAWGRLIKKDASGQVTQYAQAVGVKSTVAMVPIFMWMYGADYLKDGKSVLNTAQARQAMTVLADAYKLGLSPVGLTGQEADNLFAAGKAAIEFNGPWAINGFRNAGIDLGIAEVPAGPAAHVTWGGDTVLSITADSKVKEAAWAFIEHWNSAETQRTWALNVGFPPTRTDMGNDTELLKGNPDIVYFLRSAQYARIFLPAEPKANRIDEEILVPLYESVFRGLKTPEAALAEAHEKLNALMAE
ncbi:ABC transporter substrate-binding protein [Breznakiella homolactica]|uniref:ABC transporter substrate-binding protein n=1 Tax=Breznakiella homolactica TaxID=2798577 RepID=A0A7T8BBD2_9SPIR|nr:ABC transporter substrate-binding protein [Breznakiella homolactica]QQO09108.1 ABC transporter substrate-binding protein [Breznakiella homolactica]